MHRQLFNQIRESRDRVAIEGIHFYAYHGHISEENTLGQRFELSIHVFLDLSVAGKSDDLVDTLDYQALYQLVIEWVTTHRFHLLEKLVEGLSEEIFKRFPSTEALRLSINKLSPPIPNFFGHVQVAITRVNPTLFVDCSE
jgi:7,8-dihydroneopterin aldolase/epimerase/oxygenase